MKAHTPSASDLPALLSHLIGLIYDTASDSTLWPELLNAMSEYVAFLNPNTQWIASEDASLPLGESSLANIQHGDAADSEWDIMPWLAPHFARAQALQQQISEADHERNLLETVMDRLPLAMAIVSADGTILSMNRPLLSLVQGGGPLRFEAGRLISSPRDILKQAIHQALSDEAPDIAVRLAQERRDNPLSLWVSPMGGSKGHANNQHPHVLILVASQTTRALSEEGLRGLYGLTPAEARLTQSLAIGQTLEEAAQGLSITTNTAKTHLKKIFSKIGVRRQPELLQAIYSSPLWLDLSIPNKAITSRDSIIEALTDSSQDAAGFRLPDGRWLAYADVGDPHGIPVILMVGIICSRHFRHPDDRLLLEHGIRLIIPERPGNGDSDPQAGRRIVDWPDDVAALADHLGLKRFTVMGHSGGTSYALVTILALRERIDALYVVGAMSPIQERRDLLEHAAVVRMSMMVARYTPRLLPPMVRVMVSGIRKNVYRWIEDHLSVSPLLEKKAFDDPLLRASLAKAIWACAANGEQGILQEILLFAQDLGINLADIQVPTHIWHGELDLALTAEGAQKLARKIPEATITILHGAGHFLLFTHWREILSEIKRRTSASSLTALPEQNTPAIFFEPST